MREEAWIREIKSGAMLFLATINLPRILFISPSPSFSFALFKKNKRGSRLVQGLLWLTVKFTQGSLQENSDILREKIVGMSSDIPTKQVLGNNSSEILFSSKIPRNFPTEFRGNKFPRKLRGPPVRRKSPRNIPRENVLGIYLGSSDEMFLGIFIGKFRGNEPSENSEEQGSLVYSEEHVPRYILRVHFLGI
ncbi:hypothetical protein DY000_02047218 [Brassica cretica]|uniref:Uncharacterized protein n=1 Tax=Brassica cretica TaxID=69181 RepID=A0ABQ7F4D8_BRACR|nr:hypothetical protein DY000_02047218 [Brassica cretica]